MNSKDKVFANRGEWDAAIIHYRLALQIDPDYPWALVNLGDALSRQGKDEEAIEPYRRLIRLKPEFLPGYQRLAVILARQGKSEEAAKLLAGPK